MSSATKGLVLGGQSRVARGQALVEFAMVAPLLFFLLIFVFEAGRFILYQETLNHATREGARYAIVHGSKSSAPTGPLPFDQKSPDRTGTAVMARVEEAAIGLMASGDLVVGKPIWQLPNDTAPPTRDIAAPGPGHNGRGSHVTVFADFSYDTVIATIVNPVFNNLIGIDLLPTILIETESTLVINN